MNGKIISTVFLLLAWLASSSNADINLSGAVVVHQSEDRSNAEIMAVNLLIDEIEKRSGVHLLAGNIEDDSSVKIIVTSKIVGSVFESHAPADWIPRKQSLKEEGFFIDAQMADGKTTIWIVGADARGALFGVGYLLRKLNFSHESVALDEPLSITTSPEYPIRGHQLGYRDTANSYDAWNVEDYERYIRDLIVFGANSIENIPFQDNNDSALMTVPRDQMNIELSRLCEQYELQYWLWIPADFDLDDQSARKKALEKNRNVYQDCPRIDAVFIPGGDPGHNHPNLVIPFMEDLSKHLLRSHPHAKIWLSLQGFKAEWIDFVYDYLDKNEPEWFGGIVAGPSSPPIPETRIRLHPRYGLRHYPDITHTVRCQYPVPWWDPAYAFTLGREPINPQPLFYASIHNQFAPYTNGFIAYSDGIHDDLNKMLWSALGWDSTNDPREIVQDYARYFLNSKRASDIADGLFALEKNWDGPLASNGAVEAAHHFWNQLEPALDHNDWRAQLYLLRAAYDAYTRKRSLYETDLETKANQQLALAPTIGADRAINQALETLNQAVDKNCAPELRGNIEHLCEQLFHSIGFQTSVEKYQASGAERGAILDFVDHPLNNRWWLEDQLNEIKALSSEAEKLRRLEIIRTWETPGPGSFYDEVGSVAKSPHVIRGEGYNTDPNMRNNPNPDYMWWDGGKSRARLSWISKLDWPLGLQYTGLNPNAEYTVRLTGYGDTFLRIDGERIQPALYSKEMGAFREFPVPKHALQDRMIKLTWDIPDESHLNWRQQSRLNEVWLLKN